MKSLLTSIDLMLAESKVAIGKVTSIHELEMVKSAYLGKSGQLTNLLRQLKEIDVLNRPKMGQALNLAKEELHALMRQQGDLLKKTEIERNLKEEAIDVTLPPRGQTLGSTHPITKVQHLLENFFVPMGFSVVEGPEIEDEFYNFTALNIPPHHPARTLHDTFYFDSKTILRSQTSPVQIRAMQKMVPPLRIICPGRVFRRDNDATHSPMFHQLEMLMVDENLNFANLKWLISKFIRYFFQEKVEYRFRPSYFPFTEPSAEVDIKWRLGNAWRWLELGGCGVVHPNVLHAAGVDAKHFRGLAFGFGIDRLAMSYYGIEDIRMLFESDLQFLQQF